MRPNTHPIPVADTLRHPSDSGPIGDLPDGPFLERLQANPTQSANIPFAARCEHHGPMVFRVCHANLRDKLAAEQPSHLAFLVLARRLEPPACLPRIPREPLISRNLEASSHGRLP